MILTTKQLKRIIKEEIQEIYKGYAAEPANYKQVIRTYSDVSDSRWLKAGVSGDFKMWGKGNMDYEKETREKHYPDWSPDNFLAAFDEIERNRESIESGSNKLLGDLEFVGMDAEDISYDARNMADMDESPESVLQYIEDSVFAKDEYDEEQFQIADWDLESEGISREDLVRIIWKDVKNYWGID